MGELTISDLSVRLGGTEVLRGVDLGIPAGSLTAVLGPSGCGKTTLLRTIAGFLTPTRGTICLDGEELTNGKSVVPPERRAIGLVPQEGALFGHLSVAGNIGFGLSRAERRSGDRVAELLDLVGLNGFADRRPDELSGGQQQRVALARALAPRPRMVLLDEPFSALDAALRESVRAQVRSTLKRAGATAVLVTHDQDEALSMADSVAVMEHGRIAMHASPQEVYTQPATLSVARFVGQVVELAATVESVAGEIVWARTALGRLNVDPIETTDSTPAAGTESTETDGVVVLRPEQLQLRPPDDRRGVPGTVIETTYYGHDATHLVRITGPDSPPCQVIARGTDTPLPGQSVRVTVEGPARFYPRTTASVSD